MTTQTPQLPEIREVSREEARAYFDRQVQRLLGISGDEFLRRWREGRLTEHTPEVRCALMLLPLAVDMPVPTNGRPNAC